MARTTTLQVVSRLTSVLTATTGSSLKTLHTMARATFVNDYLPELTGGLFEASVDIPTKAAVHFLLRSIPFIQEREGDKCLDASLILLERFMGEMEEAEQVDMQGLYENAQERQEELRSKSEIHRFFHSHKYGKVAKRTYKAIKKTSQRSRERMLFQGLAQRKGITSAVPAAVQPAVPHFDPTSTIITDPFSDSHAAGGSTLEDSASAIALEVYQSNETQEDAVVLTTETPGQETSFGVSVALPSSST
ncbi:hypothetical protein FA95DRAFT_1563751 [Auriscalpium vulgare]|uniref:Uncharacterized protein n=1 Tax=Auriscalpium vulgare TaxID=40419 RepID=A0ACB8RH33_9AGAM|nr:hypothetical protein FA95DRAFT_1563751 [Auriscalpium vulgare]